MAENKKPEEKKEEKKLEEKIAGTGEKEEVKNPEPAEKKEEKRDKKIDGKKEDKKKESKTKRKTEAKVYGSDLPISTKHSIAICRFIRGKRIDEALVLLGEAVKMKRAVPMKGEVPHRKGKGMERGRYPVNALKQFTKLVKQLAANASVNEMELEKGRIECKADRANRPYKRFGSMRFKRTNVLLKLTIQKQKKNNKMKKVNKKKNKKK